MTPKSAELVEKLFNNLMNPLKMCEPMDSRLDYRTYALNEIRTALAEAVKEQIEKDIRICENHECKRTNGTDQCAFKIQEAIRRQIGPVK